KLRMGRPEIRVRPAIDFDKPVEHDVTRETALHRVLGIDIMLAVSLAITQHEPGQTDADRGQAMERVARAGQPPVKRLELPLDVGWPMPDINSEFHGRPKPRGNGEGNTQGMHEWNLR